MFMQLLSVFLSREMQRNRHTGGNLVYGGAAAWSEPKELHTSRAAHSKFRPEERRKEGKEKAVRSSGKGLSGFKVYPY